MTVSLSPATLSSAAAYGYYQIAHSDLSVFDMLNLWSARNEANRAGAFLALAPAYADLARLLSHADAVMTALVLVPAVAALMVSRWPTFSGKSLGRKLPRIMLMPPLLLALAIAACLARWPWATLCFLTLGYGAS